MHSDFMTSNSKFKLIKIEAKKIHSINTIKN